MYTTVQNMHTNATDIVRHSFRAIKIVSHYFAAIKIVSSNFRLLVKGLVLTAKRVSHHFPLSKL